MILKQANNTKFDSRTFTDGFLWQIGSVYHNYVQGYTNIEIQDKSVGGGEFSYSEIITIINLQGDINELKLVNEVLKHHEFKGSIKED